MKYYVYILYSKGHDRFYYGQTEKLDSRIDRHNDGKIKSTLKFVPWVLYAYKEVDSRSEAIKTERKIKNLKSRKRVKEFIVKHDFVIAL